MGRAICNHKREPAAIRSKRNDKGKDLYKKLSTIVIDEVSMVRADLLDCVDRFLRLNGPDVGRRTFASGQMYVALSRCTSLDGLVLRQPIRKSHILTDWRVAKFLTGLQYARSREQCPREEKLEILAAAVRDGRTVEILYLKAKDEKSCRKVRPLSVGEMECNGRPFTGLEAFCLMRREKRVFNVDKILEIVESL